MLTADGYWAEWGGWTDCDADCGGGTRGRTRACVDPVGGGVDTCTGTPSDEQEDCNEQPCPSENLTNGLALIYEDFFVWQFEISIRVIPA